VSRFDKLGHNGDVTIQILSEYLHGGLATYPPGSTFGPRVLPDYEFVWIIEGDVSYHYNGESLDTPPGSVVLCRPGFRDSFTWDTSRPTRHGFAHFVLDDMPEDLGPVEDWPVLRVMPDNDIIRPLFRYLLSSMRPIDQPELAPSPNVIRTLETMLSAFVTGHLGQAYEHELSVPDPVERAMKMIHLTIARDPASEMTLNDLANAASVTPEHLCRLFRQNLDLAPMQAFRLARLDFAMNLLARTNLNMSQIADRAGFASPYHFSRRFKEAFDAPPTTWRKRIMEGFPPPVSLLMRRQDRQA